MTCSSCKVELAADELEKKIRCDSCRAKLCQRCSGLSSTEVRVMQLTGRRTLKYTCGSCCSQGNPMLAQAMFDQRMHGMEKLITDLFNTCLSSMKADFGARMGELYDQVNMLKESNIQLVHLMMPQSLDSGEMSSRPGSSGGRGQQVRIVDKMVQHPKSSNNSSVSPPASQQTESGSVSSVPNISRRNVSSSVNTHASSSAPVDHRQRVNRRPAVVGSRKPDGSKLVAADVQKRTSIFVSRIDKQVSAGDLQDYLRSTFGPAENFLIEEQTVRSGDYRSYRVQARLDLLKQLLEPSNWPENVLVKRFRFFRRSRADA